MATLAVLTVHLVKRIVFLISSVYILGILTLYLRPAFFSTRFLYIVDVMMVELEVNWAFSFFILLQGTLVVVTMVEIINIIVLMCAQYLSNGRYWCWWNTIENPKNGRHVIWTFQIIYCCSRNRLFIIYLKFLNYLIFDVADIYLCNKLNFFLSATFYCVLSKTYFEYLRAIYAFSCWDLSRNIRFTEFDKKEITNCGRLSK